MRLTQSLEELLVLLGPLVDRELSDVDGRLVALRQDTRNLVRHLRPYQSLLLETSTSIGLRAMHLEEKYTF
jgi:hypothetical protein